MDTNNTNVKHLMTAVSHVVLQVAMGIRGNI